MANPNTVQTHRISGFLGCLEIVVLSKCQSSNLSKNIPQIWFYCLWEDYKIDVILFAHLRLWTEPATRHKGSGYGDTNRPVSAWLFVPVFFSLEKPTHLSCHSSGPATVPSPPWSPPLSPALKILSSSDFRLCHSRPKLHSTLCKQNFFPLWLRSTWPIREQTHGRQSPWHHCLSPSV